MKWTQLALLLILCSCAKLAEKSNTYVEPDQVSKKKKKSTNTFQERLSWADRR
jgi:uncharacterized lipoprotein YmbA